MRTEAQMIETKNGTQVCRLCGTPVDVTPGAVVRIGHLSVSGQSRERVIYADGKPVHQCPDVD